MNSRVRSQLVTACAVLVSLAPGARSASAQAITGTIGSIYPTQLAPGQSTVLHIAMSRGVPVQSIEITPAAGITVSATTQRDLHQGSVWWEFTVTVARDAVPGPRTLVVVEPMERTRPVTITIPDHVPAIANLKVLSAQANQPTVDLQVSATSPGGRFDATPYVWFLLACGAGQPEAGVVRGAMNNGTLRVGIPNPRSLAGHAGAPAAGNHCDLQLRATDASGADSNTLMATFDFK